MLGVLILGYFGYRFYFPASTADSTSTDSADWSEARSGGVNSEQPEVSRAKPVDPKRQNRLIDLLRDRLEEDPNNLEVLYKLSIALRNRGELDGALEIWERIAAKKSPWQELAYEQLFQNSSGATQLRYADWLVRNGSAESPANAAASYAVGSALLVQPEDSKRVEGWKLLSRAYFNGDERLRSQVRPHLVKTANQLLLSPRRTPASEEYTVQAGDSLARIARQYGTTVELLVHVNQLSSDVIHPGQTLKVLPGKVSIVVDKSEFQLDVKLDDHFLFTAPVGLGQYGKTPTATFVIETRQIHPDWHRRGHPPVPYGDPKNPLGERWLGFRNTPEHSGFGIHGTDEPDSIGTESSDGCIRLRNEDVCALFRLIPRGTQVFVRE